FHGGTSDQYYLTWNYGDYNPDIVANQFSAKPLWQNPSFRLFRAADVHDLLFTGRGFYRLEYFKPLEGYFFPNIMRWSAQGGEFYLLRPSQPGKPYRFSFDAVIGYEYPDDSRTLELYLDGVKIQEVRVTSSARVLSAPFVVTKDVHKLVVVIRERNKAMPRPMAIWNK